MQELPVSLFVLVPKSTVRDEGQDVAVIYCDSVIQEVRKRSRAMEGNLTAGRQGARVALEAWNNQPLWSDTTQHSHSVTAPAAKRDRSPLGCACAASRRSKLGPTQPLFDREVRLQVTLGTANPSDCGELCL